MLPTILSGDLFVVDSWYYPSRPIERSDTIVFDYPKETSIVYAKRVIGLPGDRIGWFQKQLFINGIQPNKQH
jgi:signal peptidase I